ncbi:MAG: hypothetical protein GY787_11415 [Alteromonadales bacterium]|nr:hypothetical protein [Alteromonadales bacterium]
MNLPDESNSQEVLLKVTKIIETECAQDASALLVDGFVLLVVGNSIYDDCESRFVYSLGFPTPTSELSKWARANL